MFDEFYYSGQLISHDSEDAEHLVDLGCTARGDLVIMNKYVYDCDLPILIGCLLYTSCLMARACFIKAFACYAVVSPESSANTRIHLLLAWRRGKP